MSNTTIRDLCAAMSGDVDYLIDCVQDGSFDPVGLQECADRANTARDLLAAEPVGEGPTDEELQRFHDENLIAWGKWRHKQESCTFEVFVLRAILARWGHPAAPPAPRPEGDWFAVAMVAQDMRARGLAEQACGDELLKLANSNRSRPARPAAPPAPEVQRDAVIAAVAEALGGAYDCQRVWEAWSVGTMGQDDFALVAEDSDRVAEIADAAIEAMRPAAPPAPPAPLKAVITVDELADVIRGDTLHPVACGFTPEDIAQHLLTHPATAGFFTFFSSCPAAPAAPEVGEVGELVAMLRREAHWNRVEAKAPVFAEQADRLDRAATLLQQQQRSLKLALQAQLDLLMEQPPAPAPAVVPVAVVERLPGEGDCDAGGRCWWFGPIDGKDITHSYWALMKGKCLHDTHWLPHHAIPLPQAGEGEG